MSEKRKKHSIISRLTIGLETPHQRLQYLAGFLATITMFMCGNFIGWSSPTAEKFKAGETPLKCSNGNWAWAVSFLTLGSVPWCIFAGKFADILGRRITLLMAAPFYLVAWIMTYFSISCYILMAARFIAGGGVAIGSAICSLYIGEITDNEIRGRLCSLVMFMQNFGVVFALAVGPYVSYKTFILILCIFPILFFLTFFWMPETPFYRLKQGNRDAAMSSLLKFRGMKEMKYLDSELNTMQEAVVKEMENQGSFVDLVSKHEYRKPLSIVLGIKTMQHFSGVVAIQSFMQSIFSDTNSGIPPEVAGVLCGIMQMIAGMFAGAFVDRFGRKPLLLSSSIGTALALFSAGLYFFLQNYIQTDVSAINWLPLLSIMFFMTIQPIGVGTLSYVFLGELFPTNIKGVATIVATMYGSASSFAVTKLFDVISNELDMFVTFWLCCTIMLLGIVFTIVWVPETKGKSLMEIQAHLNYTKNNKMIDVVA